IDRRHLRKVMGRLHLLQLDSVPVIIRTQYMPLFSRLGPYDPGLLDRVAYRDDEWFEVWSHEASLVPVGTEPLLRWSKHRSEAGETWKGLVELARKERRFVEDIYAQIAQAGPVATSELRDVRPREGDWWGSRSLGQLAADWLFRIGRIGFRRTPSFEKTYDTLDRIVPGTILAQPTPSEEAAHRELLMRSARALGVATGPELVDYYRLPKVPARDRIAELVEDGRLVPVTVEGAKRPYYLHPAVPIPRRIPGASLLSPFDPVVWNRGRAEQLFDFEYKIEIYVPKAKRRYGYYVLPFRMGDRLVARVDLKTDRSARVLRVLGAFAEPNVDRGEVAEALAAELAQLAQLVAADSVEIDRSARGDLVAELRSH
ncbi:MAG: winged helix DNA-binding domain-containing protein, partial [Deltaproteobacteria bacterium]|nr:winged helix DNA-binding domain-containing protein [Deltaproteobacteria bacterium]